LANLAKKLPELPDVDAGEPAEEEELAADIEIAVFCPSVIST